MNNMQSIPFDLFAKNARTPLTPRRLEQFAGRINRLNRRMSEPRLEITLSDAPSDYAPALSPLVLEQHDSLLPPETKIVTIGDDGHDVESEYSSLPNLQSVQASYTTATTTPEKRTPLHIAVISPRFEDDDDEDEMIQNNLLLANTPSNWEGCAFETPDGRQMSMLEISQGRVQHEADVLSSSCVVDELPIDENPHKIRSVSQFSLIVPERDDSEYEDLSALSASDDDDANQFVMVDEELQNEIRREANEQLGDEEEAFPHHRVYTEQQLGEAALVPFPSDTMPAQPSASSNTSRDRPMLSQRASLNASFNRSRAHIRGRLADILSDFDSHINTLMSNARSEFQQVKRDCQARKLVDRRSGTGNPRSRALSQQSS